MNKKIVFFGSSDFSAAVLKDLIQKGYEVVLVITQPDKPFGRKKQLKAPLVKEVALEFGVDVYQPYSLKKLEPLHRLRDLDYDFGVVVAYGKIIPQRILDTAEVSYLNGHASDLPRWRGAAPMERAIMAGDLSTAMCIMQMTSGLDEGDVLSREEIKISEDMCFKELESEMLDSCKKNLCTCIDEYSTKVCQAVEQSDQGVNYAEKIYKDSSYVNVDTQDGCEIYNLVKGLESSYGAVFSYEGKKFAVFLAKFVKKEGLDGHGELVDKTKKSFGIALQGGVLYPIEVQLEGKKRMLVQTFMSGSRLDESCCFISYGVKDGKSKKD
ncbi:MAG: methionyl-tRNA formyltransferase [Candidatus Cloacimonetes bacterium]|nr:methionyl-tRNA formyltransferase [Candidatus Cloacimonadota bacterium]